MNKLLLIFLFLPALSFADYIFLGKNDSQDEFFIDPETIYREKNISRFWVYVNFDSPEAGFEKSIRSFEEIDCNKRILITLNLSSFSDYDLKGELTDTWNPTKEITYIAPDTINELFFNAVCN